MAEGFGRRQGLLRRGEPGAYGPQAERQAEVRHPHRCHRPRSVAGPRRARVRAMTVRSAARLLLLVTLCSATAAFAGDKAIDDVDGKGFSFGAMAIGQAKDVDYARAEGLGIVPASPLDTYL